MPKVFLLDHAYQGFIDFLNESVLNRESYSFEEQGSQYLGELFPSSSYWEEPFTDEGWEVFQ